MLSSKKCKIDKSETNGNESDHTSTRSESTVNLDFHPLTEPIRQLHDKFTHLTSADCIAHPLSQLDEWKCESYRLIDQLYEMKRQEMEIIVNKNFTKYKTDQLKLINDLKKEIRKQHLAQVEHQDEVLKRRMEHVEQDLVEFQKNFIQIETKPLQVDSDYIHVQTSYIKYFNGGSLLSNEQELKLNEFYGGGNANEQQWELLYKASRNGFCAEDFHRLCDGKGATMTIIQSNDDVGYLFGGFTTVSWSSTCSWQPDPQAFLFTLTNPHNIPSTKYNVKEKSMQFAVYHDATVGPSFGGDICVKNNSNAFIRFPVTYLDTTHYGDKTFTGNKHMTISDIEIYKID
ncbi:unnamed protein product [Didymodactylos carnosus]|nr:unnamed protein product [Didymodactylos carnosus]CAF4201809.1 unnamed protein product [Didymodactylos carnosus]